MSYSNRSNRTEDRGLGQRQIEKSLAGGETPDRNAPFEHIFDLEELFEQENNPIFCMDAKKKERLGRLSTATAGSGPQLRSKPSIMTSRPGPRE